MRILGLTGSIGMGKSTAAEFFRAAGVPVYSADEAVHKFYRDKQAAAAIKSLFPEAELAGVTGPDGVDRQQLAALLLSGKSAGQQQVALAKLESLIHPYIRREEQVFIAKAAAEGHDLIVLDIPLLLESMAAAKPAAAAAAGKRADCIIVVSAPAAIQRARVLARPNMTAEKFAAIKARQMDDAEKRRRADFIIDTGGSLAETKAQIEALIARLRAEDSAGKRP